MKQVTVFKKEELVLEEPKTLKAVLEEKMLEQGLELELLEKVARNIIFSVDNVMVRDILSEVKVGANVKLIPAVKAG
jgi:molybdopterin converting factor small subunit